MEMKQFNYKKFLRKYGFREVKSGLWKNGNVEVTHNPSFSATKELYIYINDGQKRTRTNSYQYHNGTWLDTRVVSNFKVKITDLLKNSLQTQVSVI